jgi:hypothetical protein
MLERKCYLQISTEQSALKQQSISAHQRPEQHARSQHAREWICYATEQYAWSWYGLRMEHHARSIAHDELLRRNHGALSASELRKDKTGYALT